MRFFLSLFVLLNVITPNGSHASGCVVANDNNIVDSDKNVSLGVCISPSRFTGRSNSDPDTTIRALYGWKILKWSLNKNDDTERNELYEYPGFRVQTEHSYLKERYNLRSGKNLGARCNILFNTPGLFYKDFNNFGNPDQGGGTGVNLSRFWDSMLDYDTKKEREAVGFHKGKKRFAKQMFHFSDDNGNDKNRSTCSAVGMCVCKQEYNCTELSSFYNATNPVGVGSNPQATRVKNPNNFKYDLTKNKYIRKNNWCYQINPCDPGHKSPKKLCEDNNGDNCGQWTDKCLYTAECKVKTTETNYSNENLPSCNHSFECGSGYCEKLPQTVIDRVEGDVTVPNRKVCLPHALCVPKCTQLGDPLATRHDYCCVGLMNINGVCKKNATSFEEPPEMQVVTVDEDTCQYKLDYVSGNQSYCLGADHWGSQTECEANYVWTGDSIPSNVCLVNGVTFDNIPEGQCVGGQWFNDSDALKMKFIYYQRLFEAIQWLWGDADSDGSRDHFGMYDRAKLTARRLRTEETELNNAFYQIMDQAKIDFTDLSQEEGAATGVGAYTAMGNMFDSLSKLSYVRSKMYMDISGLHVVLYPQSGNLSFASMVNEGQARISGNRTDNNLSGSGYKVWVSPSSDFYSRVLVDSDSDTWKNTTLMGVWKKINSLKRVQNGSNYGSFNSHGGKNKCPFRTTHVGKNNSCKRKKPNNGQWVRARCSWERLTSGNGINDGDCIKEGWIIKDSDTGVPDIHGNPGSGGLVDGIYPMSIRSSFIQKNTDQLYTFLNKIFIEKAMAASKREHIGIEVPSRTSGQLLSNIERVWSEFANLPHEMDTHCIGAERPFIPGSINVEEAYFLDKAEGGTLDYLDFKEQVFQSMTAEEKRERFLKLSARIVRDFFINFHWHLHDPGKGTFRFYRDRDNDGEYNGIVDLINASYWLSSFYDHNQVLNRKISQCMYGKAEELKIVLGSKKGTQIRNRNNYEALMGNKNSEFPSCPNNEGRVIGNDPSDPSSPGTPGSPGTGSLGDAGDSRDIIPGENKSLAEKEKSTNKLTTGNNSKGAFENKGFINSVDVGSQTEAGTQTSTSGTSGNSGTSNVNSSKFSTNAKLNSIRKEIKKDLKKRTPFLKIFSQKIASYKKPALRISTLEESKYNAPVFASIDTSLIPSNKKPEAKVKKSIGIELDDDDNDYDEDDYEGSYSGGSGQDDTPPNEEVSRLLKNIKKRKLSYKANENDTIFQKISKTYMRVGLRRLIGKKARKRINKRGLPSLKTKNLKNKKRFLK